MPAKVSALDAAENLIAECHARHISVNPLLLQKLLYYAHAWHLVLRGGPLFPEPIEAWIHGPVVHEVYTAFKRYRWDPITDPGKATKDRRLANHYSDVLRVYGKFDARTLERLTHRETPWREARKGLAPDEPSHAVITDASMTAYYSRLVGTVSDVQP